MVLILQSHSATVTYSSQGKYLYMHFTKASISLDSCSIEQSILLSWTQHTLKDAFATCILRKALSVLFYST